MIIDDDDVQYTNALLPGSDTPMAITVSQGMVEAVEPQVLRTRTDVRTIDLAQRLVLPPLAEPHAHLDKVMTADLVPNPAGDLMGAIRAWQAHYAERTVDEIYDRALAAVEQMVAFGVTAIRTHVDVGPDIGRTAVDALAEVRHDVRDLADLQIVALVANPLVGTAGAAGRQSLTAAMEAGADLVGGCPHLEDDPAAFVEVVLDAAEDAGAPLDLHVDETLDPSMVSLAHLADAVERRGFGADVNASHCVSLSMLEPSRQAEIAARVARAGVSVVALPQTNLFLQARGQTTAPARGITPIDVLVDAGVLVAGGGDNVQDPFNTVGRGDPLETAAMLVMASHREPNEAYGLVSDASRRVMGLPAAGPSEGHVADFVAIRAPSMRGAVASAPADRVVVKGGRLVAETLVNTVVRPV